MGYVPIFQVLKLVQLVCFNDISMAFRCPGVPDTASVNGFCIISVPVPEIASVKTFDPPMNTWVSLYATGIWDLAYLILGGGGQGGLGDGGNQGYNLYIEYITVRTRLLQIRLIRSFCEMFSFHV